MPANHANALTPVSSAHETPCERQLSKKRGNARHCPGNPRHTFDIASRADKNPADLKNKSSDPDSARAPRIRRAPAERQEAHPAACLKASGPAVSREVPNTTA